MKSLFSKLKTWFGPHTRGRSLRERVGSIDKWLILGVLCVTLFGILMVYDSSVAIAIRDFGDPYYYAREQFRWLLLAYGAMIVVSRIDYHAWYKLALPMLLVTLLLLVAVFVPGLGIKALGARRWIHMGFFVFQPAELAKLVLVIYLSAWFARKEKDRLFSFLLLVGMVVGLVVIEPDLGTAIILVAVAVFLYFLSGAPLWQFGLLVPFLVVGVVGLAVTSPYRFARLTTFLHPETDTQGSSYHIHQALIAFGSGGWFGIGVGKSRQKYEYLPEANTDSIFAIVGEELGFVGATSVIVGFAFLISRGFRAAKLAPDPFGRLLALGVCCWIATQTAINLGAMVALVPLTGVPLPFISYGGSSLVVLLTGVGLLLNVSSQKPS